MANFTATRKAFIDPTTGVTVYGRAMLAIYNRSPYWYGYGVGMLPGVYQDMADAGLCKENKRYHGGLTTVTRSNMGQLWWRRIGAEIIRLAA